MVNHSLQTRVARGMAAAVAIALGVFAVAHFLPWPQWSEAAPVAARLKLAALAVLAPVTTLFVCIARLAKHRFSTPQDIQGSALTQGTDRARLLQALLQNTLEQTVLSVPLYIAAALLFPAQWLSGVAAGAALFVVGRVLFFRGYAGGAASRAIGFGLTFYPSVALLVAAMAAGLLDRHV